MAIITIELNRSTYDMGLPVIQKAGIKKKDKLYIVQSSSSYRLLQDPVNHKAFEFAFVDADKDNYLNYHEKLLKLLKPGAIVIYDITLWGGSVAIWHFAAGAEKNRKRIH